MSRVDQLPTPHWMHDTMHTLLICALLCSASILKQSASCQNGKPVLNEVKLEEFGKDGFKGFVEYACRQDHIQLAIKDGVLELEHGLSSELYLFIERSLTKYLFRNKYLVRERSINKLCFNLATHPLFFQVNSM